MKKVLSVLAILGITMAVCAFDPPQIVIKSDRLQSVTAPAASALTITSPITSNEVSTTTSNTASSIWSNIIDAVTTVDTNGYTTNVTYTASTNEIDAALASNSVVHAAVLASFTNSPFYVFNAFSFFNTGSLAVNVYTSSVIASSKIVGVVASGSNWVYDIEYPDPSIIHLYIAAVTNAETDIAAVTVSNIATALATNITTLTVSNIVTDVSTNQTVTISTNATITVITNTAFVATTNTSANTDVINVSQIGGEPVGTTPVMQH